MAAGSSSAGLRSTAGFDDAGARDVTQVRWARRMKNLGNNWDTFDVHLPRFAKERVKTKRLGTSKTFAACSPRLYEESAEEEQRR